MNLMFESESLLMKLFRRIGMESIAWSLRRIHVPVSDDALVLEVGSGGNPYARSNVLLDAYESTRERHWVPLITDRPTVLGFVENLPFKDNSFDFIIASHVFEHTPNPDKFLKEIQRVSKAGYIEVPDAFMERINPYRDHRLEVTIREKKLMIRKKSSCVLDETLKELYEKSAKALIAGKLIPKHPFSFHVRYYWSDSIDYEILNPEEDAAWIEAVDDISPEYATRSKFSLRGLGQKFFRAIFSQRSRNKKINLTSLLRCPSCGGNDLVEKNAQLVCTACMADYSIENKVPKLFFEQK
jgi:SAM-dependent methyltransferase